MLKTFLATTVGLMLCLSAFAERIPLVRVTAEAFPGEEYFIGVDTDQNLKITGLYYVDRFQPVAADRTRTFSYKEVTDGVVLISKQKYKLVTMSMIQLNENDYRVDLDYLVNAITSKVRTVQFIVRKNLSTHAFDVLDGVGKSQRRVKEAYVETNYFFSKQVGIRNIGLL